MMRLTRPIWLWVIAAIVLATACGAPAARPASSPSGSTDAPVSRTPKRIVGAIFGNPNNVVSRMNNAQVTVPGAGTIEQLINAGLGSVDGDGKIRPQLAE